MTYLKLKILILLILDETSYENILVYDISFKTLIDAKLSRIKFGKVDEFIRFYDGTRYLVYTISSIFSTSSTSLSLSLSLYIYIWCHLQED